MIVSIVVAAGKNGAIGKNNQLLWHLPDDLKFFKKVTTGHPILMGRNTFEAIGKPLPNRRNVIITRQNDFLSNGCEVVHSVEEAMILLKDSSDVMIVGGADIYKQTLGITDRVYLTRVDANLDADRFFDDLNPQEWDLTESTFHPIDEKHMYSFTIEVWNRK